MKSDLKHIYHDKYNDIDNDYVNEMGLDETISYYKDNFGKDSSKA